MPATEDQMMLRALDDIDSAETTSSVVETLSDFVEHFGFKSVSIGHLVNPAMVNDKRIKISTWPDEYMEMRLSKHTIVKDPIARHALRTTQPFTWEMAYRHADAAGRRVIDEGRDFAQNDGMMFPIHAFDEIPGCVSLGTDKLDVSGRDIKRIDMVCQQAFARISRLEGPFPYEIHVDLSTREIEVLHFVAAGKSNWEVSRIIGISEHTVRDYMRRISKKLGTTNRAHTVAVALARQIVMI